MDINARINGLKKALDSAENAAAKGKLSKIKLVEDYLRSLERLNKYLASDLSKCAELRAIIIMELKNYNNSKEG